MLPGLLRLYLLFNYQMLCGIKYNVIHTVSTKKFETTFSPDNFPFLIKMEIKIVWSGKLKLHVNEWIIARFKLFFSNPVTFIM